MGMFDYVDYNGYRYQSKDTPSQILDQYKIEVDQDDGHPYIWIDDYEAEYVECEGHILGGYIKTSNHHWHRMDTFSDTITFYRNIDAEYREWEEYVAEIQNGVVKTITRRITQE